MSSEQAQGSAVQDGRAWTVSMALLALTLVIYLPVLQYNFVSFGDSDFVTANAVVRSGLGWNSVTRAFTSTSAGFWQPLTVLSHMLDWRLYGLNPKGHHLTNLLLHAANVLLFFWLLRVMTGSVWRSACVASLFVLHPLNVESVAWIGARDNVLCTFFFLLSTALYCRYARRPALAPYLLALAAFACALMSKAAAITLPLVLILLDFWPLRRLSSWSRLGALAAEKTPLFILSIVFGLLTYHTEKAAGAVVPAAAVSMLDRLSYVVVNYVLYMDKMIWPSKLAVLYPMWTTPVSLRALLICLVLLVFVTVAVLRRTLRFPFLSVGWLWYLGTLVPMVGFVLVGHHSIADRFMYVPMLGIFIMIVWGAADFADEYGKYYRAAMVSVMILVLVALGWTTRTQLKRWSDSVSLFTHAVEVTSGNYIMHDLLGREYANRGQLNEAIGQFMQAVRINSGYLPARVNLTVTLFRFGRHDEAIALQQETVAEYPHDAQLHCDMGMMLAESGRKGEAAAELTEAVWLDPTLFKAHLQLAILLLDHGKPGDALPHLVAAVQLKPDSEQAKALLRDVSRRLGVSTQ